MYNQNCAAGPAILTVFLLHIFRLTALVLIFTQYSPKICVQPKIYRTSEIVDKCAIALIRLPCIMHPIMHMILNLYRLWGIRGSGQANIFPIAIFIYDALFKKQTTVKE